MCTPTHLATAAQQIAAGSGGNIECTILERDDCAQLGMGCYLGVAEASEEPPKFIHLTYKPQGKAFPGLKNLKLWPFRLEQKQRGVPFPFAWWPGLQFCVQVCLAVCKLHASCLNTTKHCRGGDVSAASA